MPEQPRSQLLNVYKNKIILPRALKPQQFPGSTNAEQIRIRALLALARKSVNPAMPELLTKLGLVVLESNATKPARVNYKQEDDAMNIDAPDDQDDDDMQDERQLCLKFFQYLLHRKPRRRVNRELMTPEILLEYASFGALAGIPQEVYSRLADSMSIATESSKPIFQMYCGILSYGIWQEQLKTRDLVHFSRESYDKDTGAYVDQPLDEGCLFFDNSYFVRAKEHFAECIPALGVEADEIMVYVVNLRLMEGAGEQILTDLQEYCDRNSKCTLSLKLLFSVLERKMAGVTDDEKTQTLERLVSTSRKVIQLDPMFTDRFMKIFPIISRSENVSVWENLLAIICRALDGPLPRTQGDLVLYEEYWTLLKTIFSRILRLNGDLHQLNARLTWWKKYHLNHSNHIEILRVATPHLDILYPTQEIKEIIK